VSGPYDLSSAIPVTDIQLTLTDSSGNPANGSGVTLTLTLPDNSTATPTVANPSTGTYRLNAPYVPAQAGHYLWTWTWTGTFTASSETVDSFEVRASPDPTIVSLAEAKEILKLTGVSTYDQQIRGFSQAVTEWIEYTVGPVVTQQVTEVVRAQGTVLVLSKAPIRTDLGTVFSSANRRDGSTTNGIVSIQPLLTYGFAYDLSQLLVDPQRGLVRQYAGLPWFYSGDPFGQHSITYWAGRAVVPFGIYEAAKIALKHVWAVERGGVSSGAVAYGESETTVTGYGFAVPNRAIELLTPHSGSASRAAFA
jgi:hypothetical protein